LDPATNDPLPASPEPRPRLGDLLLGAGLISQEQLEESLTLARAAGKPLGHVLVEQGLVPAHSLAMALADQHGGPLKTEFGFATGRGSTPRPAALPVQAPSTPPAVRLAAAPLPEVQAQAAEEAARLEAEARAIELLAGVVKLESDLAAERAERAVEAAALATVRDELAASLAGADELRSVIELQEQALATESPAEARAIELLTGVEQLESDLAAERAGRAVEAAALATVREELAAALAAADELRSVIELQEQALATASARALENTRAYSADTHFLFAPGAEGYELLERSGPSPAPGEVVELSGGRTCRVLRVGPPPFLGAPEACAYLELA